MSVVEELQKIRKKKDELRQETRGIREELATFRPTPIQNIIQRRINKRRKSVERRVTSARELLGMKPKVAK